VASSNWLTGIFFCYFSGYYEKNILAFFRPSPNESLNTGQNNRHRKESTIFRELVVLLQHASAWNGRRRWLLSAAPVLFHRSFSLPWAAIHGTRTEVQKRDRQNIFIYKDIEIEIFPQRVTAGTALRLSSGGRILSWIQLELRLNPVEVHHKTWISWLQLNY